MAAGGGRPLVRERFDERFLEEPDLLALQLCGVEVRTEFHFWGTFTLYADMTARTHFNDLVVSTDPDMGEVLLVERDSGNVFSEPLVETIDEGAGTLTVRVKSKRAFYADMRPMAGIELVGGKAGARSRA